VDKSFGLFSDAGVSQEFESGFKLPGLLFISLICFRRFAKRPSHGDLNPISESMGRFRGSSLITNSTSFGVSRKQNILYFEQNPQP